MRKFLAFDIYSDYGHFRKYYTTSSPLTYSIPPRTAIVGIISSIIGFGKKDNTGKSNKDYFYLMSEDVLISALQIINPIEKQYFGISLLDCKVDGTRTNLFKDLSKVNNIQIHSTQVNIELLKSPRYRLYISINDDKLYQKLKEYLLNNYTYYTPYMGIAFCILNFDFIGEYELIEKITNNLDYIDIFTVIDSDNILDIQIEEGRFYNKEKIAYLMDENRIVKKYKSYIFENNGKSIKIKLKELLKVSNVSNKDDIKYITIM
jgi:CRISPR-associated protein Cas5h